MPERVSERMMLVGVTSSRARTSLSPLAAFVLAGIAGGAGGVLLARAVLRPAPPHPIMAAAPLVIVATAVAAGVLIAWFIVSLILARTPRGRFRCPRCGTENARAVPACLAWQLPFA